ncbi:MAG: GntR family transcriptional regulator [Oscillospiraceae bacterium]|nr:GntR family transcriptional regulator [Oscillospiraceae bacterium]
MVHLDYRDARPIYVQIIDGIKEQISAGVLQPGDKLPSVRELAAALAINPNTIQRSYRQLEMEGWIVTMPGKGCFVCRDERLAEEEKARLLSGFDKAVDSLLAFGISRDTLIARLQRGGNNNA